MVIKIIVIGDIHIKTSNIVETDLFIEKMIELVDNKKPDLIVVLGDILDTFEKIHTSALNKAYEFINHMNKRAKTYILVGNHDYICNQQYLYENHWMNGMKTWKEDVYIVDKPIHLYLEGKNVILCPYVFPGRFEEALNTVDTISWRDVDCIFAHQEFKGCKMGAITSVDGDDWKEEYPMVVSGHIHSKQRPQKNIFYPGSSQQIAFGESDKSIIANIILDDAIEIEEVELNLPKKKIISVDITKVETLKIKEEENTKIRLNITGDFDEFKTFKKTEKFKELNKQGVKVVFRHKKIKNTREKELKDVVDFNSILNELVSSSKNVNLVRVYEYIINEKKLNEDDIFFL